MYRWVKRALGNVHTGDIVLDMNGTPARVLSETEPEVADEIYQMIITDGFRSLTIYASGNHAWTMNINTSAYIPIQFRHEPELTTEQLAQCTAQNSRPYLVQINAEGAPLSWQVVSCVLLPEDVRHIILTKCISVDSSTHSFMIATDDSPDTVDTTMNDLTDEMSTEEVAHMLKYSVPTHNCGSPIALDTPVKMADGTVKNQGEIEVGDVVLNRHGQPSPVVGLSPIFTDRDVYELHLKPYTGHIGTHDE